MKYSAAALCATLLHSGSAFAPSSHAKSRCAFNNVDAAFSLSRCGRAVVSTPLFGIMDEINSDAYDLSGGKSSGGDVNMNDAFEMFLAELVFSPTDVRSDIVDNYERASDPEFQTWLNIKVEGCADPEERMALRDLAEIIEDVMTKIEVNQIAQARAAQEAAEAESQRVLAAEADADAGRKMSSTDVLRKASLVDTAGVQTEMDAAEADAEVSFMYSKLTDEIRKSYGKLLKKLLPPYKKGDTPRSKVSALYEQCDAQLVKVLQERAEEGDADSAEVLTALAEEQAARMTVATDTLREVLSMGDPGRMEGSIIKMAREGRIDEAFLLLLEANAVQAEAAGATGPAQVMRKLGMRASEEKDKQSSTKEVKLLRKLLRTPNPDDRAAIIEEAFTPRDKLMVEGSYENIQMAAEGEAPEEQKPEPDVPPPDFINACKAVLLNFGNLSSDDSQGDLATRIKQIASEAEIVATKIYGQGMDSREQQDRAWKDETTSIFDLELLEVEAEQRGEEVPWANPDMDDIIPGFDTDGKMKIGGI
mmetsp:Transcript_3560/g.7361  ORF Transcript_3560/g.7361 Transcript_3560/m.7361 type:complete len:534 (+) Transcript_3560:233-1834(+)